MKARKNKLEWAVFAVSALLFLALTGWLSWDALRGGSGPPRIEVRAGTPVPLGARWAVPLMISNQGGETAGEVQLEVALQKDGAEVEKVELTVAYLPRRSSREAWALFTSDPRRLQVVPRALAFERP